MPRRIPNSHKKRREKLLLKRAVKRGDTSPPARADRDPKRNRKRKGVKAAHAPETRRADSSKRLQSSFIKLPSRFLEDTRVLAAQLPLVRPIPLDAAIFPGTYQPAPSSSSDAGSSSASDNLTCPKRPQWRYDMTKKEVEANEEGLFRKWLAQTDSILSEWCSPDVEVTSDSQAEPTEMPHAPTSFERNLEVWRQLWRVTEISDIILILLDTRCPLIHLPPALTAFLSTAAPQTRTVLVLTKVDITGPVCAAAWQAYLRARFPDTRVVQVEAYAEHDTARGERASGRQSHLPLPFRETLVDALRETHAELLVPPEHVSSDPEKAKRWVPKVKKEVDWGAVMRAEGDKVGSVIGGATAPHPHADTTQGDEGEQEGFVEPQFLTIGLIGQPNVGKSSLLNALFGVRKVKASKTPGKTKHFQTLYWTPEVRLVDCPGLVIPNFVPMEVQVLTGIFPISRVSAVPLCIYYAAQLLPLERVLALSHPTPAPDASADKRTWRAGGPVHAPTRKETPWTTMDVLTAFALSKGWITAQAGRPDVNRAGNAILRALAEGRIRWAFWPPGTDASTIEAHSHGEQGVGIWMPGDAEDIVFENVASDEEDTMTDETASDDDSLSSAEDDGATEVGGDEDDDAKLGDATGRFGALMLDEDDELSSDDDYTSGSDTGHAYD
ncbi:nucleoside triphosphate hydrolase protein [Wolfiporia cocos MD-104 SS10]|uniref:Guanine nucleotide-binding protein-like 1 n=1 Tax=Wolfiporia cocos (strain MD-104) TaxID=742152 RepID=A0A2H3IW20_WOLCO|nr:nucleoside triphosphate hydrolase protein [Wolfiporia cocos MD-104 SS10]